MNARRLAAAALLAICGSASPAAQAARDVAWPDTFVSRLEALALMQTINGRILASRSATLTLEEWCREHELAAESRIVALRVPGTDRQADAEQRQRLEAGNEPVKYRRVRLRCGARVLAEADNWYVPGRLTAEMNRVLDTTDTPFGTVVRPLDPYRQPMSVTMLWSPLPEGWERRASRPPNTGGALDMPEELFEHRAVLYTSEHRPFAEVRETYRRELLAFTRLP
jgi:hypothetical protein